MMMTNQSFPFFVDIFQVGMLELVPYSGFISRMTNFVDFVDMRITQKVPYSGFISRMTNFVDFVDL